MQTPGHIYHHMKSDLITKPRILFGLVLPDAGNVESGNKIKKSNDPDVGTYDAPESFRNTQLNGIEKNSFKLNKGKGKTFTDMVVENAKFVPGVGHYKETEKAYTRLSSSPISIRVRRH
jgi:hypothetical protein